MNSPSPSLRVRVDVTNPGQFFACCGLFELASRLSAHVDTASGWFDGEGWFHLSGTPSLIELIESIAAAEISAVAPQDRPLTALKIGGPFDLYLDWWRHESREIGKLKTWAGQMSVLNIAKDMCHSMKALSESSDFVAEDIFNITSETNEGEPFYFDICRALNASRRDVGFSVDALKQGSSALKTLTRPAVEFLCLVGLQRSRPRLVIRKREQERVYEYCTWTKPIHLALLPAAITGLLPHQSPHSFRFTNPSRTKDYRAFRPAVFVKSPR